MVTVAPGLPQTPHVSVPFIPPPPFGIGPWTAGHCGDSHTTSHARQSSALSAERRSLAPAKSVMPFAPCRQGNFPLGSPLAFSPVAQVCPQEKERGLRTDLCHFRRIP